MKYFKRLYPFVLCTFMGLVACAQADNKAPLLNLSGDAKKAYDSGKTLILYSYRDEVVLSEAYADWEAYLGYFKEEAGQHYFFSKVGREEFESIISGATEFTLFLKKGYPVFFYDEFIVEPQVYSAISRRFSKEPLTNVDRSFMPEEIVK